MYIIQYMVIIAEANQTTYGKMNKKIKTVVENSNDMLRRMQIHE